jgi:hypothetical protein
MTSRWAVEIAADRNLTLHWRPISLLMKNNTQPDSPFYEKVIRTNGLLRVFESVRAAEGEARLGALYTAYGRRIHHDQNTFFDPVEALAEAGIDTSHAAAMGDESFDAAIRSGMDEGLALTGNDVGTPILGFTNSAGKRVGFFGPVISRRLSHTEGLKLWDGIHLSADVDSFWELKRTRTESPEFGPRP